ncbi:10840_t:CDS:2 [Entrophospora sp. SA101]|nr:10840_t:CDS:2 [Entrophospora sp. SA101]
MKQKKNKRVTEDTLKTLGDPMNVLKTKFSFETGSLIDYQQKVISQPVKIDKLDSSVQGFNWRITPDKL